MALFAAIDAMTRTAEKILLVTDADKRLLGVVTDYDIRSAILRRISFDEPIGSIMVRSPITAPDTLDEDEILGIMRGKSCHALPLLDARGRVTAIRFLKEFVREVPHRDRVAVVMAGGLGSRLRPLTNNRPKPLLEVGGRSILFIVLDQILNEGFNRVYISLFYRPVDIISAVEKVPHYRDAVDFLLEEQPLGTAGALGLLPERPSDSFLVMNADLLTNMSLAEFARYHAVEGNSITLASRREDVEIPFGVVEVGDGRVIALREKPRFSYTISTGAYMLSPQVLDSIALSTRLDMPELITRQLAAGVRVGHFPIHEYWADIGTHDQYRQACSDYSDGTFTSAI
ncbi:dTDP-glucose pyrophosphorylase [Azospirillum soli]|nr:dTDP-glucose pyrophosphorylase [Azospirillum soli]